MSKKIPVSASQAPLQSPFASLEIAAPPAIEPLPQQPERTPKSQRIVLRREKSHRGGKTVIVASQFPTHLSPPELEVLLKKARRSLGCGGALAGREMEIQGDQAERVRAFFESCGFAVAGPG